VVCQGCGRGLGELSKIWGFPFNISAKAEASDSKFVTQLEFAKVHHKIAPRGKSGHSLGLVELPKIFRFHFNINTMAEASYSIMGKAKPSIAALAVRY